MGEVQNKRYLYIDNLKLLIIILVVMVHSAVTFSNIGSWYIVDKLELDLISTIFFGLFQSFTQAYFMGFLFLLSGYFVARSYDKKGCSKFLKDRFIRLGIPTLIFMLIISPFIAYMLNYVDRSQIGKVYFEYIVSFRFIGENGPLWFAFALLIFNCIYVMFRIILKNSQLSLEQKLPGKMFPLGVIVIIAVITFFVRLVQPIDSSILNMQLCFFTQYIVLFLLGVRAGRNDWFSNITYRMGRNWLLLALIPGIVFWILLIIMGGALENGLDAYKGGFTWQSAGYSLWEAFIAVSMSLGLIGIFKEKLNKQSRFIHVMAESSFGVYVFHAPILIAVSGIFMKWEIHPLAKFLGTCIIAIPLSFLFSYFIRRLWVVRKVI